MTATQKKSVKVLSSSKLVRCPICYSKVCKIDLLDGEDYVVVKHKKALVIAKDAVVKCTNCDRRYYITTNGLEKEVELGS